MAEKRDRKPRNEDRDLIDDDARDVSEEDDQFEDVETEDEDLDEDIADEEASGRDRDFTAEDGSEGGSAGDIEERRLQSGIRRGSEATETAPRSRDDGRLKDRHAGRP